MDDFSNFLIDDWLMIVGGYHWYRGEDGQYEGHVYNDTTLLALEPEQNPVPECLKPREFLFDTAWMHGGTDGGAIGTFLSDPPIKYSLKISKFISDGFPFVCGGDRVNDGRFTFTCYFKFPLFPERMLTWITKTKSYQQVEGK